jgi:hypothetical protein
LKRACAIESSISLATSKERCDAFFDLFGRKGFAEIAFGTGGKRFDDASFAAFCGDHDDGHAFGGFDAGQAFQELEAVHHGHVDVAEDYVQRTFLNFDESFGAVAGFEDLAEVQAGLAESSFDDLPHHRRVIYY